MALMKFFSKSCEKHIDKLLPLVWKSFFGSLPLYEQKVANVNHEDVEVNEDGYNTFNAYIINLVDIIHVMLEKKKYSKLIKKEIKMVIGTLMGLSQITGEHINQLMDDPNEFVSNEEDEFVATNSLRVSSRELFFKLIEMFDDFAISNILACSRDFSQKSVLLFNQKNTHWWKYRECIFHTVESISEYLLEYPKLFNLNDFCNEFIIPDSKSDNPFLKMKAFDCAASFAGYFYLFYIILYLFLFILFFLFFIFYFFIFYFFIYFRLFIYLFLFYFLFILFFSTQKKKNFLLNCACFLSNKQSIQLMMKRVL